MYVPCSLSLDNIAYLFVLREVDGRHPGLVGDVQGHPGLHHQPPDCGHVASLHCAHEAAGEAALVTEDGLDLHQPGHHLHLVTAGRPHEAHTHLLTGQPGQPALARVKEFLN